MNYKRLLLFFLVLSWSTRAQTRLPLHFFSGWSNYLLNGWGARWLEQPLPLRSIAGTPNEVPEYGSRGGGAIVTHRTITIVSDIAYFLSLSSTLTDIHIDAFAFSYTGRVRFSDRCQPIRYADSRGGAGAYWLIRCMPLLGQSTTPCQKWPLMHS